MVMQSPWSECAGGQRMAGCEASEATDDIEVRTTYFESTACHGGTPWKFVRVKVVRTPRLHNRKPLIIYSLNHMYHMSYVMYIICFICILSFKLRQHIVIGFIWLQLWLQVSWHWYLDGTSGRSSFECEKCKETI